MNWWQTDWFLTVVHTAIGALIGGIFAYAIARGQNIKVDLRDIHAYLKLTHKVIVQICKQSNDTNKYLKKRLGPNFEQDIPGFLFGLNEASGKLDKEVSKFLLYWDRYGESIQLHSTKILHYPSAKRKKYEDLISVMEGLVSEINDYTVFSKQYHMLYQEYVNHKIEYTYIHKSLSETGYREAADSLVQLTEACKRFQSIFDELHI